MNLIPFDFHGADVRVITDEQGEFWFMAKDVADLLDYVDTDQAIRTHCKGAQTCPVEITGQVRYVKVIPERDVYRLVMRSRLPAAEAFEEWVVGDVLPSLRKTGTYQRRMTPAEQALAQAQLMVDMERRQTQQEIALASVESRVALVEHTRYFDSVPAGFESTTSLRARIGLRHGVPPWVINEVMRALPYCPRPYGFVKSKHSADGGKPYPVYPVADITRLFDRFVSECTHETDQFATHPDISQGRFKLCRRRTL
jgi:prophage antirepressor-like protein